MFVNEKSAVLRQFNAANIQGATFGGTFPVTGGTIHHGYK